MEVAGTGNPPGLWPKHDLFFNNRTQLRGKGSGSTQSSVEMG